jgi:predicted phosphodiesterase
MARHRFLRALRAVAMPAAALVIVVVGLLVGLRLAGPTPDDTALGRVSYELAPSTDGGVRGYVPVADWGFRAPAFAGPVQLRVELRTIEREALGAAASGNPEILAATRDDLRDGAVQAIVRALLFGLGSVVGGCAIVTAIWPRARRARWVLPAFTAGALVLVVGVCALIARTTFSEEALESPTYFARGAELERLLMAAEAERVSSGYGSELESIVRSVSTVLAEAPIREQPGRELVVASDLHANALVIDPLARFFGAAPVLFAGDFGQRGTAGEAALLARKVAALGEQVLAVSGNHDSDVLMDRLAEAGVIVADRAPTAPGNVVVEGLKIAGYPDPFEGMGANLADPDRPITFEDAPDPEAAAERASEDLRDWFDELAERPDVVMVHQSGLAQRLAESLWRDDYRRPLVIATGHDHAQHIDRYGPVTVVDGGTVGAGGIFDAGEAFAGFAELHFDADEPVLRAVDLVAVEPFSGRGRGSRVVIDTMCPGEERCSFTPVEPEVDVPGA